MKKYKDLFNTLALQQAPFSSGKEYEVKLWCQINELKKIDTNIALSEIRKSLKLVGIKGSASNAATSHFKY